MSRNVNPKLIDFTKKRLEKNGLAMELWTKKKDLIAARDLNLMIQEAWVGIRESGGNNRGREVEWIQDTIGGVGAEAWCMADQQSSIGIVEEILDVESPLYASEHCLTVWAKTPKSARVQRLPGSGAVIIWQHGKTQNGHTGCVKRLLGNYKSQTKLKYSWTIDEAAAYGEFYKSMNVLEGNATQGLNSKGEVEREGGGHYFTERGIEGNGSMRVVGFLIPFPKVKA